MKRLIPQITFVTGALLATSLTVASVAEAQVRHVDAHRSRTVTGPNGGSVTTRTSAHATSVGRGYNGHWDRHNPNWWHGHPHFHGYHGPRNGYYFAPGHGYYAVPRAYWGRSWVVGVVVPTSMRVYVVSNPSFYGLTVAPAGYGWIYVNNNIVLINRTSGVIVRTVPRVW